MPLDDNQLTAKWDGDDGDGIGRLTIVAQSLGFGGIGRAWIDREAVVGFADRLTSFPLPEDESVVLKGGIGGSADYQAMIGLVATPLDTRGQVDVRIHLANDVLADRPPEGRYETRMHLLTTYPNLDRFARDLRLLIDGTLASAVLIGDRLE